MINGNICKDYIMNPARFQFCFIHLPAHERFYLKQLFVDLIRERETTTWIAITANQFTDGLIAGFREGLVKPYSKYIEPDFLLIDDIQFLGNKEASQEYLYILLKERLEAKKTTIFMSELALDCLCPIMNSELFHLMNVNNS